MKDATQQDSTTNPVRRKAFNWQFIGIDPEEDSARPVPEWSIARVSEWLAAVDLNAAVTSFTKEEIDGKALLELTEDDLKGLGLSLGIRKKFFIERGALQDKEKNQTPTVAGVVIPKGFIPSPPPFDTEALHRIRFKVWNSGSNEWAFRDEPLTDEEVECWQYQKKWLMCPISKKKWGDPDTILGLGLYHAPRFLSDHEMNRAITDEEAATSEKSQKKGDKIKNAAPTEVVKWAKDFNVYPAVLPPLKENLQDERVQKMLKDPMRIPLGPMQVIIGPAFDIDAYNEGIVGNARKGIKSQKDRGVLSMDLQYNAFNFVYYGLRARHTEDSFERKICTSRLSFFIEEGHGSRVFPTNIEGQISLFTFRDNRLSLKSNTYGSEPERRKHLAFAIRKMIPRVLKTTIMEVVNGRATAIDDLIDYSLRTYLLVHQVSIKLVLYYRVAYEVLYTSVMRWIKSPFSVESSEEWTDIEDLLIASSLVGISWSTMRVSFVKKLFSIMIKIAGTNISSKQWLETVFLQNKALIYRILYEFSFLFTSNNRNIAQTDRLYSRCAGSLPKTERDTMKAMVMDVEKLSSLSEFWLTLGMDEPTTSEEDIEAHIKAFSTDIINNQPTWSKEHASEESISVPQVETIPFTRSSPPPSYTATPTTTSTTTNNSYSSSSSYKPTTTTTTTTSSYSSSSSRATPAATARPLVLKSTITAARDAEFLADAKLHEGYPPLATGGNLDRTTCNYAGCGKKFATRDALFRHLRKFIDKKRMITGYHQGHFKLNVTDKEVLTCGACSQVFASKAEIFKHYQEKGVKGDWSDPNANSNNNNENTQCIICMAKPRGVVNVPCGHSVACVDCAPLSKECPICRKAIDSTVRVFFS